MQMICILLGVPESERHWLFEAIEPQFDFGGSRTAALAQLSAEEAGSRMYSYGQELIASKRAQPTDDMLSVVANATLDDLDGPAMSDLELYLFFSLLFSAGAETTRNAVGGGLLALADHPEQLRRCATIWTSCRLPSRRWFVGHRRRRPNGAPPPGMSRSADSRSPRGRRCRSGKARPTGTRRVRRRPTNSTSTGSRTRTWVSVKVCIIAWVRTWRGWSFACSSKNCCHVSTSVQVVRDVEWTRSNRHTGIRHLVVELR